MITSFLLEETRDGLGVAELMQSGRSVLGRAELPMAQHYFLL